MARKLGGGGGRAGHATPGEPRDYEVMKAKFQEGCGFAASNVQRVHFS